MSTNQKISPKREAEIRAACQREADALALVKELCDQSAKARAALIKHADGWPYPSKHMQQGQLETGIADILKHPYCEPGPWRERLVERYGVFTAARAELAKAEARVKELPSLLSMSNEVSGVMSDLFHERISAIYDRVYPHIRRYCVENKFFDESAETIAERLTNELPRLKELHLKEKYVGGKTEAGKIDSMLSFIAYLEETREADTN